MESRSGYAPRWLPAILGIALSGGLGMAQEAPKVDPQVASLRQGYESALKAAKTNLQTLEDRYVEELKKLKAEVEAAGDLKAALLIQDEIQHFTAPKTRDFSASPALQRLRNLYQEGARRLEPEVMAKRKAVMEDYARRFEQLVVTLTQQSQLAPALQAKEQAEAIRAALQGGGLPAPSATATALWTLTAKRDVEIVKECELDQKGDRFIITSRHRDGSLINTDKSFELPIRISARVGTDTTNVRFYFGGNPLVIFNWEENPSQLRIHNPITRSPRAFDGVGYLARNQLFDIMIDVKKESISVFLGGKEIGKMTGDFTGVSGPVGIGPAFASVITVERFEVFEIKETAKAAP